MVELGVWSFDPTCNPAVLDTATWDVDDAWRLVSELDDAYWSAVQAAADKGKAPPAAPGFVPHTPSLVRLGADRYFLASLADGQQVFIGLGMRGQALPLGRPARSKDLAGSRRLMLYPTDMPVIHDFCNELRPSSGPRALGAVPRLGLGCRMSTAAWPGYYRAMAQVPFAANAIQNSVRELHLLNDLREGVAPEANYAPNFGMIESGHTGSTFEGLWTYGVLEALKSEGELVYGADADHIKVKPGAGLARCRKVLAAARYYTFFTMDVSAVLDYGALDADDPAGEAFLPARIRDDAERRDVVAYHRAGGVKPDAAIGRFVGKYWAAFEAMDELTAYILDLKANEPFDLEFAIDEVPVGCTACDCVTSDAELRFVLLEARRRGLPITHVAPNFGIEKEVDYRCYDGLAGLEQRVRQQARLGEAFGVMLDFHSGDDLTAETIAVIGRASSGRNHFKISPSLQLLFAQTLSEHCPDVFRDWWNDTLAYAQREAAAGSPLAASCLAEYRASDNPEPSPGFSVFHHYNFASVGRRDAGGRFVLRPALYSLPQAFYDDYHNRLAEHVSRLAHTLFAKDAA